MEASNDEGRGLKQARYGCTVGKMEISMQNAECRMQNDEMGTWPQYECSIIIRTSIYPASRIRLQ